LPSADGGINQWLLFFEVLIFTSVATNGIILLCHVGVSSSVLLSSPGGKICVFCSALCGLLLVQRLMRWFADHIAGDYVAVSASTERRRLRESAWSDRLTLYGLKNTAKKENKYSNIEIQQEMEGLARAKATNLCDNTGWAMEPIFFVVLSLVPFAASAIHVPWYCSLPLCCLLCSYHHTKRARKGVHTIQSIICDNDMFKVLMKEMPAFVFDSDNQRCEWFNTVLNRSWRFFTVSVCDMIQAEIEPLLKENKPAFIKSLVFKKMSLGTVAPKVLAIKVLQGEGQKGSEKVELEVDFKWVSNLQIVFKATLDPVGEVVIQVANFQFSGVLRIELGPLMAGLNPFEAVGVTFMKRPLIDFSLSFGDADIDLLNVDLFSLNNKGAGIGGAIRTLLKSTIEDIVVYPKWIRIPLVEGIKVDEETHPCGVITLTILTCSNLTIGDITTSDPFVEIPWLGETHRTEIIYRTLNPVWENATFNLLVHDLSNQTLKLKVADSDLGYTIGPLVSPLGSVEVPLAKLEHAKSTEAEFNLVDTPTGSIKIRMLFTSFAKQKKSKNNDESDDEDVLYSIPKWALIEDDMVGESKSESKSGIEGEGQISKGCGSVEDMFIWEASHHPVNEKKRESLRRASLKATGSSKKKRESLRKISVKDGGSEVTAADTLSHQVLAARDAVINAFSDTNDQESVDSDPSRMNHSIKSTSTIGHVAGLLTVTNVACSQLVLRRIIGGNTSGPALNAYVELGVCGTIKKTTPIPKTTLQNFPEKFDFIVKNADFDVLRMTIKHKGTFKSSRLCTIQLRISDVVKSPEGVFHFQERFDSPKGEGTITLTCKYTEQGSPRKGFPSPYKFP